MALHADPKYTDGITPVCLGVRRERDIRRADDAERFLTQPFIGFNRGGSLLLGVFLQTPERAFGIVYRSQVDRPVKLVRCYRDMLALDLAEVLDVEARPQYEEAAPDLSHGGPPPEELRLMLEYCGRHHVPVDLGELEEEAARGIIPMDFLRDVPPDLVASLRNPNPVRRAMLAEFAYGSGKAPGSRFARH